MVLRVSASFSKPSFPLQKDRVVFSFDLKILGEVGLVGDTGSWTYIIDPAFLRVYPSLGMILKGSHDGIPLLLP